MHSVGKFTLAFFPSFLQGFHSINHVEISDPSNFCEVTFAFKNATNVDLDLRTPSIRTRIT